jgi:hypothetical protein
MDSIYLDMFRGQISRECKFAINAVSEMKRGLEIIGKSNQSREGQPQGDLEARKQGLDLFWYSAESFLRATGNISKVFWPPPPLSRNKDLSDITKKRGEHLQRIYQMSDNSPLKNRTLRDLFEHFDERLDEWFYSSEHHNLFDSNLLPRQFVAKSKDYLRNFDPVEWVLFFAGDELEFKPIIESVVELKQKTDRPVFDSGEKPGSK